MIPFVQSKKTWETPMEECYFSRPATLLKVFFLHGCFSRFLDCTNGTKLRKASHMPPENNKRKK